MLIDADLHSIQAYCGKAGKGKMQEKYHVPAELDACHLQKKTSLSVCTVCQEIRQKSAEFLKFAIIA